MMLVTVSASPTTEKTLGGGSPKGSLPGARVSWQPLPAVAKAGKAAAAANMVMATAVVVAPGLCSVRTLALEGDRCGFLVGRNVVVAPAPGAAPCWLPNLGCLGQPLLGRWLAKKGAGQPALARRAPRARA